MLQHSKKHVCGFKCIFVLKEELKLKLPLKRVNNLSVVTFSKLAAGVVCLPPCGFPTGSVHLSYPPSPTPAVCLSHPLCILWLTGGNIWTVLNVCAAVCIVCVCAHAAFSHTLFWSAVLYSKAKDRGRGQSLLAGPPVGSSWHVKLASTSRQSVTSGGLADANASWN